MRITLGPYTVVTTRKLNNILCTLFLQLYIQKPVMSNISQVAAAGMQVDVHIMSHALLQGLSKVSYKSFNFPTICTVYVYPTAPPSNSTLNQ